MTYYLIFEKQNKMYFTFEVKELDSQYESLKGRGWKFVGFTKRGLFDACKICEMHNKPILEERCK